MNPQILESITAAVGNTPLIRLRRVVAGLKSRVLAKLEYLNPGGSSNDRTAVRIIEGAEQSGKLKPGGTIVEATSGNTGGGLAMAAAVKGYRVILTVPDKIGQEKIRMLKAYGADVIVCPAAVSPDSPESYYAVAQRLARETPSAFLANHFASPDSPQVHYDTTGPEIWQQTEGKITALVCGIGSGGTISGIARFLKEQNAAIKVIGVDAAGSVVKAYFDTGTAAAGNPFLLEGIGSERVPECWWREHLDEIVQVDDRESFQMARRLAREEGILAGGSSGSAAVAAVRVAKELDPKDVVVTVFPDTGLYYLSKFYSDEWMKENRFLDIGKASVHDLLESKGSELPGLVTIAPGATVREALALMEKHNISQVPVLDEGKSVGSLEESALMARVLESAELLEQSVRPVMEASFPVVHADDTLEHAKYLLARRYPAILVQDHDQLVGLITKYDLISFIA